MNETEESNATSTQPPSNANEGCVGPTSSSAGQASACEGCPNQGACSSGAFNSLEALSKEQEETRALQQALQPVEHVVMVLSGKGGVGKSTLASQLAHTLAHQGFAVGLLDVDLCGPSAPRMAGVNVGGNTNSNTSSPAQPSYVVHQSGSGLWNPIFHPTQPNLLVMSIAFLLPDPNAAVVWRGPRKNALIQQFLTQVDWSAGDTHGLDYLIIDTPPGTSDEHISTVQYLQRATSRLHALVVTTPEEVSLQDVRKELNFCQKTHLPVLGVVENMSVLQTSLSQLTFTTKDGVDITEQILKALRDACPDVMDCQVTTPFQHTSTHTNSNGGLSGAQQMAAQYGAPYWGSLPLDPLLGQCCEQGLGVVETFPNAPAAKCMLDICSRLVKALPLAEDDDGGADEEDKAQKMVT